MFEDIKKVLLITDMDGTFLPESKIPSIRNLQAVRKFQDAGGKFSIATGRALQASQQYFESFDVNCPIIMCNGGMLYDVENESQVYDVFLPNESRDYVRQILRENPQVGCEVLLLDGVYVPRMTDMEKLHCEICKVDPIICSIDDIPDNWYKVLFTNIPENMGELVSFVKSQDYKQVDFVLSAPQFYEMLPQNISKGTALEQMRKSCNMEDYTIVAIGDYNNDIEMIKYADVGVCPANATDEVKAVADIILDVSCEEDAIATLIEIISTKLN